MVPNTLKYIIHEAQQEKGAVRSIMAAAILLGDIHTVLYIVYDPCLFNENHFAPHELAQMRYQLRELILALKRDER